MGRAHLPAKITPLQAISVHPSPSDQQLIREGAWQPGVPVLASVAA